MVHGLSLWQPYASLVADGIKLIETRLNPTHVRGRFVVCASKKVTPPEMLGDLAARLERRGVDPRPYMTPSALPRGEALAVVTLEDCRPMRPGDEPWALVGRVEPVTGRDRFAYILKDRAPIARVAFTGKQGWFWFPRGLIHERGRGDPWRSGDRTGTGFYQDVQSGKLGVKQPR